MESFAIRWSRRYPYDTWYRRTYNIVYGSSAHLETRLSDLKFMWLEWKRRELDRLRVDLEERISEITRGACTKVSDYIEMNSAKAKAQERVFHEHIIMASMEREAKEAGGNKK